ncbi:MAG: SDR family oxidoreductase [bacterium]|nr:SDR family oxidoreductase [bacterium]
MKTVLIAGGAGFIGANLCRYLLEKGETIIALDNLITGREANVRELLSSPRFTLVKQDVTQKFDLPGHVDEIYDLACPASPDDFSRHPLEILSVCSSGVRNLLELALTNKAKFLQTSTSEVYGDPLEHPQKETYWGHVNPIGPRSCYDEGKRFAESLIVNFRQKTGLDAKIVRIFNTYGPYMRVDDGRVVSNFLTQALGGQDLTVYGDGSQTRSFCYVSDTVEGLTKMMASNELGPINIGNPGEFTIKELAEKVMRLVGSRSQLTFKPIMKDDPKQRRPDISLAKEKLGWWPKVSLDEGLPLSLPWFKKGLGSG